MANEYDSLLEEEPKTSEYDQLLAPEPQQPAPQSTFEKVGEAVQQGYGYAQKGLMLAMNPTAELHKLAFPEEAKLVETPLVSPNLLKSIVYGGLTPERKLLESLGEGGKTAARIVGGIGEVAAEQAAGFTSPESLALLAVAPLAKIAGAPGGFRTFGRPKPPEIPTTLRETVFGKEPAPEPPITAEAEVAPTVEPVLGKVEPVAPITPTGTGGAFRPIELRTPTEPIGTSMTGEPIHAPEVHGVIWREPDGMYRLSTGDEFAVRQHQDFDTLAEAQDAAQSVGLTHPDKGWFTAEKIPETAPRTTPVREAESVATAPLLPKETVIKPVEEVTDASQITSTEGVTQPEVRARVGKEAPLRQQGTVTEAQPEAQVAAPEAGQVAPEWKISGRTGKTASSWETEGASIAIESRKKGAGTGGKRYVATVGDEQYGALDLESAKSWAESKLKPAPVSLPTEQLPLKPIQEKVGRMQIPEDATVDVLGKRPNGEKVTIKGMNAREAEGIFTKERSSYKALLECLSA